MDVRLHVCAALWLLTCFKTFPSEVTRHQIETSEGSRVETVGLHGNRVNFTWIRPESPIDWLQARSQCASIDADLPKVEEMRYFYKTLRSDDAILPGRSVRNESKNGVAFYLDDVLEATMDYPNTESGERMCLVAEKSPNLPVSFEGQFLRGHSWSFVVFSG